MAIADLILVNVADMWYVKEFTPPDALVGCCLEEEAMNVIHAWQISIAGTCALTLAATFCYLKTSHTCHTNDQLFLHS